VTSAVAAPADRATTARAWLAVLGVAAGVATLVPPLSRIARTWESGDALQFAVLALGVPALVVLGAPWRYLGPLGRIAARRAASSRASSGVPALLAQVLVVVAWRTPAAVGAVDRHVSLLALEALSLLVVGVALWLELVDSAPMVPRTVPSRRIVLATVAMWTVWIVAYVAGMAHGEGYPGFHHTAGQGLSAGADQQLATVLLFFAAAAAYLPVIFSNLFAWLGAEERTGADGSAWRLRPDHVPPS
jgi:cytochrome c oxidase assembly factor CtaG